ncbi:MAG: hypothetical protein RMX96_30400 [Nostoc sp. ChiSLP02]|nr:hypothetical protein [Nostoc sp. DedSLP05]MDZ8189141.1 hypothetical protein [Nostoc sp. ChiSLP02]
MKQLINLKQPYLTVVEEKFLSFLEYEYDGETDSRAIWQFGIHTILIAALIGITTHQNSEKIVWQTQLKPLLLLFWRRPVARVL